MTSNNVLSDCIGMDGRVPRDDGASPPNERQTVQRLSLLPPEFLALLDGPVTVCLVTCNPNGTTHLSPVWLGRDDTLLYVTAVRNWVTDRNVHARPQVSLVLVDPADPQLRMTVLGVVESVVDDESAHEPAITELPRQTAPRSRRSATTAEPAGRDGRIVYRIRPLRLLLSPCRADC